ncbi:MAG: outer membrane protein assembly factor, partial [Phycisphaerae bacterium]
MTGSSSRRLVAILPFVIILFAWLAVDPAIAQQATTRPPDGTPIRRVEIRGLSAINEGFVRRTIKTREAQNFTEQQVNEDVRELLRTRKFLNVTADARMDETEAVVTFIVAEKPEIRSVELQGNKQFTNEQLFKELSFTAGSPEDRYEINRGRENIERKYREKGYYYVEVTLDDEALARSQSVIYKIVEGPRVRVREIEFEGVRAFSETVLRFRVKTSRYFPVFSEGAFDEDQADRDAVDLQEYYRKEGFLDARVGYRLDFDSVDRTRLIVVFVVEEGTRYRVDEFRVAGNEIFSAERVRGAMLLREGEFLRDEVLQQDIRRIEDLYGEIGYVDTRVNTTYDFREEPGKVILNISIAESKRSTFGRITIRGNSTTRDEVIRRELRFYPGEDYNTVKARDAERRIMELGLFSKATITPLEDLEGTREALVEVEEGNVIDFLIGAGVSSDSGLLGSITLRNRNFDLADWPRTWGEFIRGRAFRGDGQRISLQFEPGTEVTRFRLDYTEPYLFDKPLRFDLGLYVFDRDRESYDERRYGIVPALSKRFDTGLLAGWAIEGALRLEGIRLDDLRPLAANDIRDVRGSSVLTTIKGSLVRDTTDSRLVPTKGSRFVFAWEQAGGPGDYDFGKPTASYTYYRTLRTDVYDRKSVLALRADTGYIVGDAPVFERYYGGGFGSIRGFDYRGVTPRAGLFNDRVGGDFILLAGA